MTKYGRMIAEVVLNSHDHPTAEEIYLALRQKGVNLSMATVYNNLKSLTEEGILQKLSMDGTSDRFDQPSHHQHLVCTRCGALADVYLRDLTDIIRQDTQVEPDAYDIRIAYVCPKCRKAMHEEKNEQGA